jgi:hypothetical protein
MHILVRMPNTLFMVEIHHYCLCFLPLFSSHAVPVLFPVVNYDICKDGTSAAHAKGALRPLKKIGF